MTIPRSTSWRILGFTEGMDIGPTGEDWFCGATDPSDNEGIEWEAYPGSGWNVKYGRTADDQKIWVTPGSSGTRHIRMVPATIDRLTLATLVGADFGVLTFVAATKTISRSVGTWTSLIPESDYSIPGTKITIAGSGSNNGTYTVVGLGPANQDLVVAEALVNEGPTAAPTVTGYREFLVSRWSSTVRIQKPAADAVVRLYGARPDDNLGGLADASYDLASDTWTFSITIPTPGGSSSVVLSSDVIPGDYVEFILTFVPEENAIHYWAGGKYRGSSPVHDYTATLSWLNTMGVIVTSGFAVATVNITSWLVGLVAGAGSIKPTGQTGPDKVVPLGRCCGFDAKKSSDPDDDILGYKWRLIAAPSTSASVVMGSDGTSTVPYRFTAASLAALMAPIQPGDILMLAGVPYDIVAVSGATTLTIVGSLPAMTGAEFMIIRQSGCLGATSRVFSFKPDVQGLFIASLRVWDPHGLFADTDLAVCSAIQDLVPLGVPLDMGWMWQYLSDFWQIVQGKDWAPAAWMALARMASALTQDLWNVDFDKSLATTQDVVSRRWLPYHPRLDEMDPDAVTFESRLAPAVGVDRRYPATDLDTLTLPGPFPVVFTLTSYQEDGAHLLDISVPPGTLYRGIPTVMNAALAAAAGFETISFAWRKTDPSFVASLGPPPVLVQLYALAGASAQYAFTVADDSFAFFKRTTDSTLGGAYGVRLSSRVAWLDCLDVDQQIKLGDPINLGSRSFQVTAVTQRSGVAPTPTGYNPDGWVWLEVEVDKDIPVDAPITFRWCVPSFWKSARTPWWDAGFTPGDLAFVERRPTGDVTAHATETQMEVAAAGDHTLGTLNHEMFWPAYDWRLSYGRRHFYIQTDSRVLEIPRLQEAPDKPTWVMEGWNHHMVDDRRNGRYVIMDFRTEPASEMDSGYLHRDRGPVVFLNDRLWAELTHWDNRPQVEANFGRMVGAYYRDFEAGIETNYLSIVTGLWYVYANGPTPANIETACALISGYPYAEADGTILAIVEDFVPRHSYALVRDNDQSAIVRSYVFETGDGIAVNPETGVAYATGDTIKRFTLFVKTQIYYDYITDPGWWKSLVSGGMFSEPEKIHRFAVLLNIDFVDAALLTVVFSFLLDFKKSHTYPLFAGMLKRSTDIEIQDTVELTNTLHLPTSLWSYPVPQHLDRPRLGAGIEIKPPTANLHDSFYVRCVAPAAHANGPGWVYKVALRLMDYNAPGAPSGVADTVTLDDTTNPPWKLFTVEYDPEVTTAAHIVGVINANAVANLLMRAYLPPGAVVDLRPWAHDGKFRVDAVTPGLAIQLTVQVGALSVVDGAGTVTVTAPLATTIQDIVDAINDPGTGSDLVTASEHGTAISGVLEAAVPPGLPLTIDLHNGEDLIEADVGWSILNYRGGFQLQLEGGGRSFPWLPGVIDEKSVLKSFNGDTILAEDIGTNIIAAVDVGSGGKYRIRVGNVGGQRFHNSPGGGPPWPIAPTDLTALGDWLVFYDTSGFWPVFRSMGRILGTETPMESTVPITGTPARIFGTVEGPFTLTGVETIVILDCVCGEVLIGGPPGTYSAEAAAFGITSAILGAGGVTVAKAVGNKVVLETLTFGPSASIGISRGTMAAILGFSIGDLTFGADDPFIGTGYPNFYNDGSDNWVDVQLAAGASPPVTDDVFQVYRGMPDRALMDFSGGTDTDLGAGPGDNYVSAVVDLGLILDPITGLPDGTGRHQIHITLAGGFGRQFMQAGANKPTALRNGQDWFWFLDGDHTGPTPGHTPVGFACLLGLDSDTQAELITAVGSPIPTSKCSFVVLRNPSVTYWWNLWTAADGDGTMHLLTLPKPGVDVANFPPKAGGTVT